MRGWIYLIRNGNLYKIGITRNIINRMKQLKPDQVIVKSYISNFKELEKHLHSRYKKVRIPQTEYFRLNSLDVNDCKRLIIFNSHSMYHFIRIFIRLLIHIFIVFTLFIIINYLITYDWRIVFSNSLKYTEKVSFLFMLISCIKKSGERFVLIDEVKFRMKRVFIYLLFTFSLNCLSQISQYYFLE